MLHARAGDGDPWLQLLHGDARARPGGQGRVLGPGRGLLPARRLPGGGGHLLQHHHLLLHGRTVGSSSFYHHPISFNLCRCRPGNPHPSPPDPPSTPCPKEPGWFRAGDSCYLVSLQPMSWHVAQEVGREQIITLCFRNSMFCLSPPQFCWSRRGHLAEIKSKAEEDTLDQYLVHGILYWIGLSDLAVEGRMEDSA